jgi:mRNA interferase MazF
VAAKQQAQIWWANLPAPLNWRPVLILTRSSALANLLWVTVAPLTRTTRGIESEVLLDPDDDGVPQSCAVTLDNIAMVEHDLLVQHITTLTAQRMDEVWEAMHFAFDLPF